MKYRRRIFFTDKQKAVIWDRYPEGSDPSEVAGHFSYMQFDLD